MLGFGFGVSGVLKRVPYFLPVFEFASLVLSSRFHFFNARYVHFSV